jgi:hypothetical protein
VLYKMAAGNAALESALTGIPQNYEIDHSRDDWKPGPHGSVSRWACRRGRRRAEAARDGSCGCCAAGRWLASHDAKIHHDCNSCHSAHRHRGLGAGSGATRPVARRGADSVRRLGWRHSAMPSTAPNNRDPRRPIVRQQYRPDADETNSDRFRRADH